MTVVYVDSVFVLNTVMDYLLLLSTARLTGVPLRRRRYLLAALAGGVYAVAVFLPGGGFWPRHRQRRQQALCWHCWLMVGKKSCSA